MIVRRPCVEPASTRAASLGATNQPTCLYYCQPSSNLSSTSRPPRRWASTCSGGPCWHTPTRGSSEEAWLGGMRSLSPSVSPSYVLRHSDLQAREPAELPVETTAAV